MSSRTSEAAVSLLLLASLAACAPDVRTVDVCGRGDRADLAAAMSGGRLEIAVLDPLGSVRASASVPASGARAALAMDGGRTVRVLGSDAGGTPRAAGQAEIGSGDVCVCLALDGQTGACAGVTCRLEGDHCAFFDAASGAPAGSRELALDAVDTTLVAAAPDTAHGDEASLRTAAGAEVALVRFDARVLPRTSVIEDATLELTLLPPPAAPPGVAVRVVPVLQAWDEASATWNQRSTGVPWASPGCGEGGAGACANEPWAGFDADRAAERYRVPLGRRVAPWVSGASANDGLALVATGGETALWSREGQGDGAAPPRLVVHYHMADDDLPVPEDGPICGNGLTEAGEACDDGDRDDTDACTNACQPARCGDGITRAGVEDCDDGNTTNDDGCSARCLRCADANAGATFVGADGRCYARYDTPRNYGVAENACDEAGHGTLAAFETRAEADAVLAGLGGPLAARWIGLSDRATEGSFVWATGVAPGYDAFAPGEPASPPAAAGEDCVAETAGAWADLGCGELHGYVCERDGWTVEADGRAWLPVVGPTIDWDAARLECEDLSAHLAVLTTGADSDRVHALAAFPLWIGLSERGHEDTLAWITGEPLGVTRFATLPALGGGTFCTELDPDGAWSVAPCFQKRRFVCEAE